MGIFILSVITNYNMQSILNTLLLTTFLLFTVNSKRVRRENYHTQSNRYNRYSKTSDTSRYGYSRKIQPQQEKTLGKCFQNIDLNRMKCVHPYLTEDKSSFEKVTKKSCCCAFIGSGWISDKNNFCDLCPLMIDKYGDISKEYSELCGNVSNGLTFTFYK